MDNKIAIADTKKSPMLASKHPKRHKAFWIFKKYNIPICAIIIDCPIDHFTDVMYGRATASKELNDNIAILYEQLRMDTCWERRSDD